MLVLKNENFLNYYQILILKNAILEKIKFFIHFNYY
jgi:hypothetical protein